MPPSSLSKVPPTNHSWQNSLASRIWRGQGSSLIAIRDAWVCDLYTSIHNWCGRSQSKCGSTDIFRKLFVQGGYEWLVTVVSIVYLLTFCVFELRYLEWCHRSLVVKGELTRCNELITYTDVWRARVTRISTCVSVVLCVYSCKVWFLCYLSHV